MCCIAQMTNGIPDILPKSPEAFAITKYGDLTAFIPSSQADHPEDQQQTTGTRKRE